MNCHLFFFLMYIWQRIANHRWSEDYIHTLWQYWQRKRMGTAGLCAIPILQAYKTNLFIKVLLASCGRLGR